MTGIYLEQAYCLHISTKISPFREFFPFLKSRQEVDSRPHLNLAFVQVSFFSLLPHGRRSISDILIRQSPPQTRPTMLAPWRKPLFSMSTHNTRGDQGIVEERIWARDYIIQVCIILTPTYLLLSHYTHKYKHTLCITLHENEHGGHKVQSHAHY